MVLESACLYHDINYKVKWFYQLSIEKITLCSRNGWKTNSSRLKLDIREVSCNSSSSLFHILHLFLCMNSTFPLFKGTVKVISSDPSCKDLYLIINVEDIVDL